MLLLSVVHVHVDDIRRRCRCDVSAFFLLCVELRSSMVDVSTFEDPIDVNFIIIVVTVVVPHVCVCLFVVFTATCI